MLRYFLELLLGLLRGIAGAAVACLPRRVWPRFGELPVHRALMSSALVTLFVGAAIQIVNYFFEIRKISLAVANATWTIAEAQAKYGGTARFIPGDITSQHMQAAMLPSAIAIALTTPWGLLATYLTVSAALRVAAWAANDPMGDPLLTSLHALWQWDRKRARRYREEGRRHRLEGPERPDCLIPGSNAGLPGVEFVLLASRRKPAWDAGAIVMTASGWFRLGEPYDIRLREGLRTAYPLTAMEPNEVVRRGVAYELPPVDATVFAPRQQS